MQARRLMRQRHAPERFHSHTPQALPVYVPGLPWLRSRIARALLRRPLAEVSHKRAAARGGLGLWYALMPRHFNDDVWLQKESEVRKHYESLGVGKSIALAMGRAWRFLGSWRSLVASGIHPATWIEPPVNGLASADVLRRQVQPINITTPDGVLLDAALVRPRGYPDPADARKLPVLVMALANCEFYEDMLPKARMWSNALDIRVLVYNGRGVGQSLGHELTTEDEVVDFEAAMLRAAELSRELAVFSRSLGGGTSATGLERLQNNAAFKRRAHVGLYINENSFTTLKAAALPLAGRLAAWGLQLLVWIGGFNMLNAEKALRRTRLADKVLVTYVPDDQIIRRGARLHEALAAKPTTANNVVIAENVVFNPNNAHNAYSQSYVLDDMLSQWRETISVPRRHDSAAAAEIPNNM